MIKPRTHFTLGLVGAPFGLEGFVKVKTFSGETSHFLQLKKVILRLNGKDEACDVSETLVKGDSLLMRFPGIESPEAAKALIGAEIIVEREFASPLGDGEFYIEDLKGLEVVNNERETLAHISNIVEGGGGLLAELKLDSGELRFVPYRKEFFGEVELNNGKIILLEPWILE